MKINIKKMLPSIFLSVMLLFSSFITAYADDEITVNGQNAKVGDIVTFEFDIGGISDPLEAAGAYIEYDTNALEYVEGSIGFDVFKNAMYNIVPGKIYYSAIDVINGFDLSADRNMSVKLSFTVLEGAKGSVVIDHYFDEIFTLTNEEEDIPEDSYNSASVVTVNTYTENDAPNLGIDAQRIEEFENSSDTNFDNLMLGTDMDELIASNIALGSEAEGVSQSSDGVSNAAQSSGESTSASNGAQSDEENGGSNSKSLVIIVAVIFILLLVGAGAMALISKKNKDQQ